MKINYILFLILVVGSFPSNIYAGSLNKFQPSFIVKSNNDTIYGVGNISKDQSYCLFKPIGKNKFIEINPQEIKSFKIIDGPYYISKQVEEDNSKLKWYFLHYLVAGRIDLFSLDVSGRFFIRKGDEKLLELKIRKKFVERNGKEYLAFDKLYIGYLRVYMSDKPDLFPKIDQIKLSHNDLVKLVYEYNKSFSDKIKSVNYTTSVILPTYQIEVFSGINHHRGSITPSLGFLFHIWRALRNRHLYINTGIIYGTLPDSDIPDGEFGYGIKIPFSIQYVFGDKKFKPTVSVGFPTGINLGALIDGGFPGFSSVQAGFIYSISHKIQLGFNTSIDGLLVLIGGNQDYVFNNKFPYSFHVGLIFPINRKKH